MCNLCSDIIVSGCFSVCWPVLPKCSYCFSCYLVFVSFFVVVVLPSFLFVISLAGCSSLLLLSFCQQKIRNPGLPPQKSMPVQNGRFL